MTATEILAELKSMGHQSIKDVLIKHGVREPFFGVKIEDLKKIQKRIKKDYKLSLELYDTGVSDAMYLAGLIADDARMTKKDLQKWVRGAYCSLHSESTVPWVAAGSPHGWELAREWIDSNDENIVTAGWFTLISLMKTKEDADLDLSELKRLLQRVATTIHSQPNRVRYAMNSFVIGVGSFVAPLKEEAIKTARGIGEVTVDMGDTSCKVPSAEEYIKKVEARGAIGKKRKSAKC